MEMGQEVVLASSTLEIEAVNHKVGALNPFDVLNLLSHICQGCLLLVIKDFLLV